jgi:TRAP-type C4-dicarboxylate transport system substrate-binding protein
MSGARLRVGGYQPDASVHTRAMLHLAQTLAGLPGGGWSVEWHGDITSEGRRAADLLAMVEEGALDLCYFASSYLADRVPSLGVFDLPFVISDRLELQARLDGPPGARLAADVASASGYRLLGFWDNGFRHVSNRLRPIRSVEDCRGLRLRILDNALHRRIFASFGFEPVVIDVRHLVEAVTSHEVDAQENPLTNFVNFGLHRLHPHLSLTSHLAGVALLLANRAWFDRLPADARTALEAAARQATVEQRALAAAEDDRCLALVRQAGVAVVPSREIDRAGFRQAASAVTGEHMARLSLDVRAEFGLA